MLATSMCTVMRLAAATPCNLFLLVFFYGLLEHLPPLFVLFLH